MAWAEQLKSGSWSAVWRDTAGKKQRYTDPLWRTERQAKNYAVEQENRARRGDSAYGGRGPTWGDWRDEWLRLRRVEASTAASDATRLDRWVSPRWERVRLRQITRADVQTWVRDLERDMAAASVHKVFRLLAASMRSAVEHDRLPVNPCVGIKLPTAAKGVERYLSRHELDLVLDGMGQPYRAAVALMATTGLRFGEMAGLHWSRVDVERGNIDVQETWSPSDRSIKPYPKGGRGRHVPVPGWTLGLLVEAQAGRVGQSRCGLPHAKGSPCRSDLVLRGPGGAPLDAHNMRDRQWLPAVQHAGLDHARLHDLRHTAASWWRQGGVPLEVVQRLLGHSSVVTTQRYSHIGNHEIDAARAVMEASAPDLPYQPPEALAG